jgi:DNA-directed RNA polymerase specialized sigma24 family protein
VTAQPSDPPIEHLLRQLTPQVLGIVVRRFRDFAAAEDAVQEASLAAAMQWPRDGLPENPRAWLTQGAFRRMTDHIRSESARRRRGTGELGDRSPDFCPVTRRTVTLRQRRHGRDPKNPPREELPRLHPRGGATGMALYSGAIP